jgi:hypothetical protein
MGLFQVQPHFGFPMMMLFQDGTAHDAARRAFTPSAAYVLPRTVEGLPQRQPQRGAMPKAATPARPEASRTPITPVTVKGNAKRCAMKGCKKPVSGRQTYCCDACKQKAYRQRQTKKTAPK